MLQGFDELYSYCQSDLCCVVKCIACLACHCCVVLLVICTWHLLQPALGEELPHSICNMHV